MLCNRFKGILPLTIVLVNDDTEARDRLMLPTSVIPQVLVCTLVADGRWLETPIH
jgi:hypothetical protein